MSQKPEEQLIALSTFLKREGLSASKELVLEFEKKVKPDDIETKELKRYKIAHIKSAIKKFKIPFQKIERKAASVVQHTFVMKDGKEYIMVRTNSIFSTPYSTNKVLAYFEGQDVFKATKEFVSISREVDEKAEVLDFREPAFRTMMKFVIESKDNRILK